MSEANLPPPTADTSKNSSPRSGFTRRGVLVTASAVSAGVAVGAAVPMGLNRLARSQSPDGTHFLTPEEMLRLDAVCAQIIPTDHDAGAREAGCVHYIDRQLARHLKKHQGTYRAGLAALDSSVRAETGKPFEELASAEQIAFLKRMEAGKLPPGPWENVKPQEFFRLVRDHTMQGFYGSPRHGGNRDYVSFRMLGIEYPRVIGRNRHGA